ncbi:MAG: hypothetical protein ABR564_06080 [Candidatus Dormibacteria bacterium]
MAQTRGSPWERRRKPVRELFFLDRLSLPTVVAVLIAVAAAAAAVGRLALLTHIHFATERDAGEQLNPFAAFLGAGSGVFTAAPGWLATLFFIYALVRLEGAPLEPPPGAIPPERRSVSQLRAGLRAEFRLVRLALVGLSLIATIDTVRALEYVLASFRGNTVAHDSLLLTLAEAGGLLAAALTLAIWVWRFRAELEHLGALSRF